MNAENDFQGQERNGDKGSQQGSIGQFDPSGKMPGGQDGAIFVECFNDDLQSLPRRDDAENIVKVHVHEGRDIKSLVTALYDLRAHAGLYGDQIGMPLAESVVHFPEDGFEFHVAAMAEEHAERIKGPAKQTRHGKQAHRPSIRCHACRRHCGIYLLAQPKPAAVASVPAMK